MKPILYGRYDHSTDDIRVLPRRTRYTDNRNEPIAVSARVRLSHIERLQLAADAGFDTWDDYHGER